MATEEDKTGEGEVSKSKEARCRGMRKMPGEGGATMHHRHIHDDAPQAHPRQEAYDDNNENNNNKDYYDNYDIAISKVMGIMLGGFDRMGEGDSKKCKSWF